MTSKQLVRLPFISDEMREEFGHDLRLIDNDREWTPEAVDFACVVVAPAVQAEIERLRAALERQAKISDAPSACPTCRYMGGIAREALRGCIEADIQGLRTDSERFVWWFSNDHEGPKAAFLPEYVRGLQKHWTLDQWRSAIDRAMQQVETPPANPWIKREVELRCRHCGSDLTKELLQGPGPCGFSNNYGRCVLMLGHDGKHELK